MGKNRKSSYSVKNRALVRAGDEDIYAIILKPLGGNTFKIYCSDSQARIGRLRGSLRGKVAIREKDIVLATKDIGDSSKCTIVLKYTDDEISQLKESRAITDDMLNPKVLDDEEGLSKNIVFL